ncbi:MAG: aminopeptidase [Firmicutes bacterium]|jgi:hypothetical protein|nr:aminopeptidase [Bacillota bacterium]
MKTYSELYSIKNQSYYDNREYFIEELMKINRLTPSSEVDEYFKQLSSYMLEIILLEKKMGGQYFDNPLEELISDNNNIYKWMTKNNYSKSYLNPVYSSLKVGDDLGRALSSLFFTTVSLVKAVYRKKYFLIDSHVKRLLNLYQLKDKENFSAVVENEISSYYNGSLNERVSMTIDQTYNGYNKFFNDIIMKSDLSNPNYLMQFGYYITETEIKMSEFMSKCPEKEISDMAKYMVQCYIDGFKRDGKDISKRKFVRIIALLGQERLTKELLKELKENNLEGFVCDFESTKVNEQMDYDHSFDNRLYLNEDYVKSYIGEFSKTLEEYKESVSQYSGILVVEKFGEDPFSPISNEKRYTFDDIHNDLFKKMKMDIRQEIENSIPEEESNFSIIAFPTPEIGSDFEDIYKDTVKLNTLNNKEYEEIQGKIIDALDKGDYVEIKGSNSNSTDLKIAMNRLSNPEKETNFFNCVADVNVPLGEVFTSPVLKGTSGILNVGSIYLNGYDYKNLKIHFEDGYTIKYSCDNFESDEENIKYIEENLMFPHKHLPMGEFAIGTNTMAYMMSKKYGIMEKLPILIIEKMGPHFAIGDTCYSWAEDVKIYNPTDGKEIVAKDNELSIKRKEDINKAYTNKHIDITIPYDELDYIKVVTRDKEEIYVIKDGKFDLAGTEALNEYL